MLTALNPSHAAIKISINATAAGFISKNIFPTPVQVKKIIKNKIGDMLQIYLYWLTKETQQQKSKLFYSSSNFE